MSKRTKTASAATNPKNFWPTPREAVMPLTRHLVPGTVYDEPCAGDGAIMRVLAEHGMLCAAAHDVIPTGPGILLGDATKLPVGGRLIVTNPPYAQPLLQPLLDHWIGNREAWLLLPSDMLMNVWSNPYVRHIDRILPLGRVSWMQNGQAGMENSAWLHFTKESVDLILPRS